MLADLNSPHNDRAFFTSPLVNSRSSLSIICSLLQESYQNEEDDEFNAEAEILEKEIMEQIKYKLSKDYGFVSPENKVFKGRNLVDFCKQTKLSYDSMYLILRGKQAVHKGWRVA